MSEFQEADQRLGAMHGYGPRAAEGVSTPSLELIDRLGRIEAKLDALIQGLRERGSL